MIQQYLAYIPRVQLEGDLGEIVAIRAEISLYIDIREK